MDVSTIIKLSRDQTATSAWQIADADYLTYLNIIYKDLFSRLSVNSKKYTWQSFDTEVNAWQSEYILPQPWEDTTGIKLVLKAFLNGKEIPLYDTSLYDSEQDVRDPKRHEQPYWILRDGSIFLIPIPKEDGELYLEWKYIPLDLELTNTSDEIKLAPEYHNILIKGLNGLVFGAKQVFDKQQLWEWYYRDGVQQIQTEWSFEMESAYHVEDPYLWFLE
jgi:hypothetical protein